MVTELKPNQRRAPLRLTPTWVPRSFLQPGKRLKLRLPAKRVPDAIERWIRHYQANRNDGEEFNAFVERVGVPELEALVKDLSLPVEFNLENMQHFVDWERHEPYKVVRGEGECAV